MKKASVWRWINLAAFLATVTVNILAELLPIGKGSTRSISELYPSPLTPAPVTFMIWAVIYTGLAVMTVWQLFASVKRNPGLPERIGPLFLLGSTSNIAWILCWHFDLQTPAMLFMLLLLTSLILLESRLRTSDGMPERWPVRVPVSLYYGWITVATIANISVWLMSLGFTGFGLPSQLLQVIVLLIGGAIITLAIMRNRDPVYGVAAMWGYAGILIRHLSLDLTPVIYPWTITAAYICEAAFCWAILDTVWQSRATDPITAGFSLRHPRITGTVSPTKNKPE